MIGLGWVEVFERFDGGGDGFVEATGFVQGFFGGFCQLFFFFRSVKSDGLVVMATVAELAAGVGGVVGFPEGIEQVVVGDLVGVIVDLYGFDMTGGIGADLFVGGVFHGAAAVAGDDCFDAFEIAERRLHAPEAAAGKGGFDQVWIVFEFAEVGKVVGVHGKFYVLLFKQIQVLPTNTMVLLLHFS